MSTKHEQILDFLQMSTDVYKRILGGETLSTVEITHLFGGPGRT
jgi:hypothetical protein